MARPRTLPYQQWMGRCYSLTAAGYYRCPSSLQYLHRDVWRHHRGDIPAGGVIHHIDGDRSNNTIENLEFHTSHAEHMRLHWEQGDMTTIPKEQRQ